MQTTKNVRIIPATIAPKATATGKPLRVAAYARVSTKKDEQHLSYEHQRDAYTDMIMQNPQWQFAGIYADKGITGTSAAKRPDFMRLITDCKRGKIDLVITKSVQRFARNTVDSLAHTRLLKSMGVGVIFENQNINTLKMENEFMLTIYSSLAQAESENLSANVKWGKQKSAQNGNVAISYSTFLGYRKGADGKAEIVPAEAEIVREIYEKFLAGQSQKDIAANLTTANIPTPAGKAIWTGGTVASILRQEKYMGDALLGKTYTADPITHKLMKNDGSRPQYYVSDCLPPIIDKATWNRVQEELARRANKQKTKQIGTKTEQGKYSSKFALTELLVCGECGSPYRRVTWSRRGKKKIMWRCISRLDYGTKYCKHSPSIEENALQAAILKAMSDIGELDTTPLKNAVSAVVAPCASDNAAARLAAIEREIAALIPLVSSAENPADYDGKFKALLDEKLAIKEQMDTAMQAENHSLAEQSRLDEIFNTIDELKDTPLEWDETMIRQLIDCVKVNGEKIEVQFSCDEIREIAY